MASYTAYKLLHFIGAFMVLLALGSLFAVNAVAGSRKAAWQKFTGTTSGVGLVIILVAGFGLTVRLGIGFPLWIIVKLLIWLALGALIAVSNRAPEAGRALWWSALGLAALAAYVGAYRPF